MLLLFFPQWNGKCFADFWHLAVFRFLCGLCASIVCNPSKWVSRSLFIHSPLLNPSLWGSRHTLRTLDATTNKRHQSDDDVIKVILGSLAEIIIKSQERLPRRVIVSDGAGSCWRFYDWSVPHKNVHNKNIKHIKYKIKHTHCENKLCKG